MKITFRLIVSLLIVVALTAIVFSFYQVSAERLRLTSELERRAIVLAESLQESAIPLVQSNALPRLNRLVERFGNRERLKGVAVLDGQGNIIVTTAGLKSHILQPLPQAVTSVAERRPVDGFLAVEGKKTYIYALPLSAEDQLIGSLALFYDASYIGVRLEGIWKHNLFRFLTLSVLIAVITLLVIRWSITGPIANFAEWMRELRMGKSKISQPVPSVRGDILAPLITEAAHLAKSLAIARARAEEEARLRVQAESLWTANRLKEHMRVELGGKKLFLISNREPYMHVKDGRNVKCITPAGGLVTALDPVMRICDGVWIAHGSGEADREVVDAGDRLRVPPEEPAYALKRIWLTKEEETDTIMVFRMRDFGPYAILLTHVPFSGWRIGFYYQKVNEKFAEALLQEVADEESPLVLIQDYHLALLPFLVKKKRPDAKIALFWHIPWPNPEAYGICPWHREILMGMLAADIVGFHIQFHCNNFLDTVDRFLESKIDWEQFSSEPRRAHDVDKALSHKCQF